MTVDIGCTEGLLEDLLQGLLASLSTAICTTRGYDGMSVMDLSCLSIAIVFIKGISGVHFTD